MAGAHLQASVSVPREHAALVESLMLGQGALAVALTDVADTPILEPGLDETPLWPQVTLCGLFPLDTDTTLVTAALQLAPVAAVDWTPLAEQAWERAWMDRFQPMRFGQRLWIVPTGMHCPIENALELRLDPGLAFGTGTHPTTRLCLNWLDGAELAGWQVLDFGCGSGVLGIAAALCGAARVVGVDYDPQAVQASLDNAARNAVGDRMQAHQGDTPPEGLFDLVLANILAGVLVRLAKPLQAALRPGGQILLAGILEHQAQEVIAAFAPGLALRQLGSDEGWVLLGNRTP